MSQQSFIRGLSVVLFSLVFFGFLYSVNKEHNIPKAPYEIELQPNLVEKKMIEKMKKVLVDTIWCEDRSSIRSMELVLSVMYNRAEEKNLKEVYKAAIKPYQFSCLNDPKTIKTQSFSRKDQIRYTQAVEIVNKFVSGKFKPRTNAVFYYAANKIAKPKYLESRKLVLIFGDHHFYA